MAIATMRMGIKLAMILNTVSVMHYIHQVGWEKDMEVDSLVWEARPSNGAPLY